MEIRVKSLQILPRNNSCTNANYIWARSCGNGESKNANPPFVQSTKKAARACKLFLLHHRRIEKAMEIRVNSLQILPRNNGCTNANYIWARSCGNGEAKNANPRFVQSTHKAVRACKLFLLHHRRIEKAMEIRVNSLQILPRNNGCTNANYIWARSCGNGEAKNANPPFVQSTHEAVRACNLFLLHHRRIEKVIGNSRKFPANPTTEQQLHQCKLHMSKKLWEWGGQKRKPSVCAINAQSGTSLQFVPPAPSPHRKGNWKFA